MTRTYLYGVLGGPAPPAGAGPAGVAGGPVRVVRHDGLAAIVSDYADGDLRDLPRESLLRCLLDHQRVLEWAVAEGDVLPAEFGTLLADDPQAEEVLAHCRDAMASQLRSIHGSVEVEVAATWDVERMLRRVADEEPVRRAREAAARDGAGLEARIELGRLVERRLHELRAGYRERVLDALRPVALDTAANALLSDQMVVNVAVLVDRGRRAELEARVHELDRDLPDVDFRLVGPMPPYSFSTVRVSRLAAPEVAAACRALDLDLPVTEAAVHRSYRRLAAGAQGGEGAASRLAELRSAREVLARRCGAGAGDPDDRWTVSVRRPQVEDVDPARFGGRG